VGLVLALLSGYGVFLVFTSVTYGWRGVGPGPRLGQGRTTSRQRVGEWMTQAGLDGVGISQFLSMVAVLFVVGTVVAFALFGGALPALAAGAFASTFPVAAYRARRAQRRSDAREAWPRMLDEMRIMIGSAGRSIPQALFEVGERGPDDMRSPFRAAHREWMISTDFSRTIAVLKSQLADHTADAACETLLVAHEVGGNDLDRRLAALIDDRVLDLQGRKDARSKQSGVRFARRFVLLVPLGMAAAGLSIGPGRLAYQTASGQAAVALGIAITVACWMWAGRLLRLPEEERVFHD
jgi:tight adherence protein B